MSPVLWFFHGFLGEPSDGQIFKSLSEKIDLRLFPLAEWISKQNNVSFKNLGPLLLKEVQSIDPQGTGPHILVGYSLGGRIAAHLFLTRPDLFQNLFLLSTHLGLVSESERAARRASDGVWANKFLYDSWAQVLQDWMSQPVFQGQKRIERLESAFDRKILAKMLNELSLGHQDFLVPQLQPFSNKVNFIYGERDHKFSSLAREYREAGISCVEIKKASHRVLRDQGEAALKVVQQALKL